MTVRTGPIHGQLGAASVDGATHHNAAESNWDALRVTLKMDGNPSAAMGWVVIRSSPAELQQAATARDVPLDVGVVACSRSSTVSYWEYDEDLTETQAQVHPGNEPDTVVIEVSGVDSTGETIRMMAVLHVPRTQPGPNGEPDSIDTDGTASTVVEGTDGIRLTLTGPRDSGMDYMELNLAGVTLPSPNDGALVLRLDDGSCASNATLRQASEDGAWLGQKNGVQLSVVAENGNSARQYVATVTWEDASGARIRWAEPAR